MKSPSKIVALVCWIVVSMLLLPMAVLDTAHPEIRMIEDHDYRLSDHLQILHAKPLYSIISSVITETAGYLVIGGILVCLYWLARSQKRRLSICIISLVVPYLLYGPLPLFVGEFDRWLETKMFFLFGQVIAPLCLGETLKYYADTIWNIPHSGEWWRERSWGVMWLAMGIWTYCWIILLSVELWEKRKAQQHPPAAASLAEVTEETQGKVF